MDKQLDSNLRKIFSLKPSVAGDFSRIKIHYKGFEISICSDGQCWINSLLQGKISEKTFELYDNYLRNLRMGDCEYAKLLNMIVTNDLRVRKIERIVSENK